MPQLNGNDAFTNPLCYDCTGYAGQSFPYTTALSGYDTYKIHMWGDFALTALTLIDTNPPVPPAPNFTIAASVFARQRRDGRRRGKLSEQLHLHAQWRRRIRAGVFRNGPRTARRSARPPITPSRCDTNRTLVANFVPAFTVATSVSPSYGGTASGDGTFNSNSVVMVTATPNTGFKFVNWTEFGTLVSTSANYSFNLTGEPQPRGELRARRRQRDV